MHRSKNFVLYKVGKIWKGKKEINIPIWPNGSKFLKWLRSVLLYSFTVFYLREECTALLTKKKQKNKQTNKQTKSIAFRICLQLVSILYIYRERERERYLYGSTLGKSTFLESRSFWVWPWIWQFSLIKNFFALTCLFFSFFFFNWEKPWVPYTINKYIVGIMIKFIMSLTVFFLGENLDS